MSAPFHDFSVPLEQPRRITVQRPADVPLYAAAESLSDAIRDLADTGARHHFGDALANGKPIDAGAMARIVDAYRRATLGFHEALADLTGVPKDIDVTEIAALGDALAAVARARTATDGQRSAAA